MTKMTPVLIRIEAELLARIDELRGEIPRVAYIRNRLAELVEGDRLPQTAAAIRKPPAKITARAPEAKREGLSIPTGPQPIPPGSRLKPGKGKK